MAQFLYGEDYNEFLGWEADTPREAFVNTFFQAVRHASNNRDVMFLNLDMMARCANLDLTDTANRKFFNRYNNMLIRYNPYLAAHSHYTDRDSLMVAIKHAACEQGETIHE